MTVAQDLEKVKLTAIAKSINNVYSWIEVKAVDEERREFTGIATTPDTDRVGDVVESAGAEFQLPIPLLWQHDRLSPVGKVVRAKVTKAGIEVTCKIEKADAPAGLAARLEEAWQSVKLGLVRGLSIGFTAIEYSFMDNGGIHFTKWDWLELSLVTIPANAQGSVHSIKQFMNSQSEGGAASGTKPLPVVKTSAGVTAKPLIKTPLEGTKMKTNAEKIKGFEETRKQKAAELQALHDSLGDSTPDADHIQKLDEIEGEIKAIDDYLPRLKALEQNQVVTAKPVVDESGMQKKLEVGTAQARTVEKLEPGIAMARMTICLIQAKGDHAKAFQMAERYYPKSTDVCSLLKAQADGFRIEPTLRLKATVAAGDTINSTWAAPLVYQQRTSQDFIEYLRARTLIGQAQFRPIPFNVNIARQTSGGTSRWVGQGKSKPVTKFDFDSISTQFTKVAGIAVITQELARFSDPSAEAIVRDQLADTVIERIDTDLFDPNLAAVANVNPAGLLNGVSPVAGPSNTTADQIRCAILRLWAPWDTTMLGTRPAYYTTPAVARFLASLRDSLGNKYFPGTTNAGGDLDGVPIRTSQYLANTGGSGGAPFILVDENEIYLADDGNVTIDVSQEATIEMSDTPVGSSNATVTSNGSPFVSMFQTNSMAIRAERFIWWGKRRSAAVQWIDGMPLSC